MNKFLIFLAVILISSNFYLLKKVNDLEKKKQNLTDKIKKKDETIANLNLEKKIKNKKKDYNIVRKNNNTETLPIENSLLKKEQNEFVNRENYVPNSFPIKSDFYISKKFSKKHPATDYSVKDGEDVYAAAAGVVIYSDYDDDFGYNIVIDHLNGFKTRYAHLKENSARLKTFLEKEEKLGEVGLTGNTNGPHLHFELIKKNKNIKPIF